MENGKHRRFLSTLTRMVVINLAILYASKQAVEIVKQTQFCKSVDSNTIFARPFLPKPLSPRNKKQYGVVKKEEIVRPTTVPTKTDVLFGTRYDSKYIGNYINFLNYHPGNMEMKDQFDTYTESRYAAMYDLG